MCAETRTERSGTGQADCGQRGEGNLGRRDNSKRNHKETFAPYKLSGFTSGHVSSGSPVSVSAVLEAGGSRGGVQTFRIWGGCNGSCEPRTRGGVGFRAIDC